MGTILNEFRVAARGLVRRPAFTFIAAVTLALGIGANTAIFSAVYHLLIAPLPFANADRIAYVWWASESGSMWLAPRTPLLDAWVAADLRTVEALEPYEQAQVTVVGENGPDVVRAARITSTLPRTLGVSILLGRGFDAAEQQPGGPAVAMLSESYWRSRYGGSPDVLGRTIELDDASHTIVGVVADRLARFHGRPEPTAVWLPFVRTATLQAANLLAVIAPGATKDGVEAELARIAAGVELPAISSEPWVPLVNTARDMHGPLLRDGLLVLLATVSLVLLVACANVAGLLIVRAGSRVREIAVRAALGASRLRLAGTLVTEALLIAVLGGALGLLLGAWLIDVVRAMRPAQLDGLATIALDPAVLGFTAALSLATALLFGIAPVGVVFGAEPGGLMKQAGSAGGARGGRLRSVLVAAQIATSVVLLVGAALLVRSVANMQARDVGFRAEGMLTGRILLPESRYATADGRAAFADRLTERLFALPDVEAATVTLGIPPDYGASFGDVVRDGGIPVETGSSVTPVAWVDSAFFAVTGVPLVNGRGFDAGSADRDEVVVNETLARLAWPGEDPIGRRIRIGGRDDDPGSLVVGIAGDVRTPRSLRSSSQVYYPIDFFFGEVTIALRARSGDPLALVDPLRAAVADIDPALPVRELATAEAKLADTIASDRFLMTLLTVFAVLAVVLSAVGLYGVVSQSVVRRTREIGIRLALGARPGEVRDLILRQGVLLAAIGVGVGVFAAVATVRVLASRDSFAIVFRGVEPYDPLAFVGAVCITAAAVVAATLVPATVAAALDPVRALRTD